MGCGPIRMRSVHRDCRFSRALTGITPALLPVRALDMLKPMHCTDREADPRWVGSRTHSCNLCQSAHFTDREADPWRVGSRTHLRDLHCFMHFTDREADPRWVGSRTHLCDFCMEVTRLVSALTMDSVIGLPRELNQKPNSNL